MFYLNDLVETTDLYVITQWVLGEKSMEQAGQRDLTSYISGCDEEFHIVIMLVFYAVE